MRRYWNNSVRYNMQSVYVNICIFNLATFSVTSTINVEYKFPKVNLHYYVIHISVFVTEEVIVGYY